MCKWHCTQVAEGQRRMERWGLTHKALLLGETLAVTDALRVTNHSDKTWSRRGHIYEAHSSERH